MAGKRNGPEVYADRRAKVLRAARRKNGSVCLITHPEDVCYLSGFSGEDSHLLMGASWAVLLTDGRYGEQAEQECPDIDVHVRRGPMCRAIADRLAGRRLKRLIVQAEHLTLRMHRVLSKTLDCELLGAEGLTSEARILKDAAEVAAIRRAVRAAERAFRELTGQGAAAFVGRPEREVAAELEYRMRLAGASGPSFETIVAAGAAGSRPHYRPGGRKIRRGEPVLIDWGAKVDGYCSDLTRVVFTGRIPPKIAEIYEVVLRAQQAGIRAVVQNAPAAEVDAAAREMIEDAGYGERFMHGLGHGIGREIHEAPGVASTSDGRLRAGMVTTIEPGIYLPGVGGVRIEDDVLVTAKGRRRLSTLPRQLAAMALDPGG